MEFGLSGTLLLLGNPLEKVCGSKPVHAAPQARFAENRRGDATGD